jgi:hypothetical protein
MSKPRERYMTVLGGYTLDMHKEAMRERCDESGHDYENCCSAFLQVYQQCKWCGQKR